MARSAGNAPVGPITARRPTTGDLHTFGRKVCEVSQPAEVLQRIAAAMDEVPVEARGDARIPGELIGKMDGAWRSGMG